MKTINPGTKAHRSFAVERADINLDARTVPLAFSSELPYERWWGIEILDHTPSSVDLTRLKSGGPLLMDHDTCDQIGVIESVQIGMDRVGRAVVRFGKSERAEEVFQDVIDGIRTNVSVGYMINEAKLVKSKGDPQDGDPEDTYLVTSWTPYEVSIVSVPADFTVGVGRSANEQTPIIEIPNQEQIKMPETKVEVVDVAAAEARGAQGALSATKEILAIGNQYKCADLAAQAIQDGKTVEQFKSAVLERMASAPAATDIPLTTKERKEYSYQRAISAALDMVEGRKTSGLEAEISQELERSLPASYKRNGGILVPLSLQRAAVSEALYNTSGKGAEAVFTQPGDLIELLRNRSVLVELGARMLSGLQGPVSFPKQSGANTAYWVAENSGTNVTAGNAALASVALAPKTLQATTAYSRQLLAQSTFDVESFIRGDLASVNALAWDKAGLHGAGASNEPDGLYHLSGVNSVAFGGVPTFGKLVDLVTEVAKDNALNGSLAFVTTPGLAGKLAQTSIEASTNAQKIWNGPLNEGTLAGYRALASNQVSSTLVGGAEHGILFGNWEEMLIGLWGSLEIVVDPYALKKQGLVEITSFQLVDIAARHAESFAKGTGATIV